MDLRRLQDTEDVSDTSNIQNNPLKDGQLVEFYQNLFKE